MPIQVTLHHTTHYRYDRPVLLGPQTIRLRPAPHCRTPIHGYSLQVVPTNHHLSWQQDPQANFQARLLFAEATTEFTVAVDLTAELVPLNPFDFFLEPNASQFPFQYDRETANELCAYLRTERGVDRGAEGGVDRADEPAGPKVASFLSEIPGEKAGTMEFLVGLNNRIQREIAYVRRPEAGIRSCEETLDLRQGSCRDSAWLLVQIARHLGLAARFVSGYLIQTEDEKGESADLHAWAEVYLPGAGWLGFDPTSGLLAAEGHIPLACTPEPARAAPISGQITVCEAEIHHDMRVMRC